MGVTIMEIRLSDQLLGRRENASSAHGKTLPQLARQIGFSDTEIAELERVYTVPQR
ncbi:MAG: hypothetical protein AAGM04_00260 [Pseudomonadota bacterium]